MRGGPGRIRTSNHFVMNLSRPQPAAETARPAFEPEKMPANCGLSVRDSETSVGWLEGLELLPAHGRSTSNCGLASWHQLRTTMGVSMTGRMNRQILLKTRPEGAPSPDNFELTETPIPEPSEGEVLLRILYLS